MAVTGIWTTDEEGRIVFVPFDPPIEIYHDHDHREDS